MKFYEEKFGVHRMFWGAFEWDPQWRSREMMLSQEGGRPDLQLTKAEILAMLPCETAIEYIGGLPGGGKSLLSCKLIFDELVHGHRPIVTNLAINVARLQEYLHECGHAVHLERRLYVLQKHEVQTFYLRRSPTLLIDTPSPGAADPFIDWLPTQNDDQAAGGVFYVIDECHNYFHPQAFDKVKMTPEHPLFQWASQHRKLKDRCYFVTQSIENVHVSVRRLGQQFHYVRNYRKETFRGFRRGDGFMRTTYLKQPKTGTEVPIEEIPFRLDVRGLASCYWTAGGVGIASKGVGDGGFKKKGIHMRWVWVVAIGGSLAMLGFLFVVPRMAVGAVAKGTAGANKPEDVAAAAQPTKGEISTARPLNAQETPKRPLPIEQSKPAAEVFCTGYVFDGQRLNVFLSDGSVRTEDDGTILRAGRHSFDISGIGRVYIRRAPGQMGAGVKVTPVRQDTPVPAAVSANVPTGSRSGAENSPVAATESAQITTATIQRDSGAWATGADGVSRLRESVTLTSDLSLSRGPGLVR